MGSTVFMTSTESPYWNILVTFVSDERSGTKSELDKCFLMGGLPSSQKSKAISKFKSAFSSKRG